MNQPICRPHYHYPREIKRPWWGFWLSVLLCLVAVGATGYIGMSLWFKLYPIQQEKVVDVYANMNSEQMETIRKLQQQVDLLHHMNQDLKDVNSIQKKMIQAKNGVIPNGNR